MVPLIFGGVVEICKLCRFVAGRQVAPTRKTSTSIYDLGFTITTFCRTRYLENWMWTAQATDLWQHYSHDFYILILWWLRNSVGFTPSARRNGLPTDMRTTGMRAQSSTLKKKHRFVHVILARGPSHLVPFQFATSRCQPHDPLHLPRLADLIFFLRHFDRRMFSSKACFTGQSPGIGHDASHIYISGAPECVEEGAKSKPVSFWPQNAQKQDLFYWSPS